MKDKKEERILIFKIENPCSDNCEIKDIQSCKTCNVKKRYDEAITYDTAIDKMAKAGWMATVCAKSKIIPVDITKDMWDKEWGKLRKDYKDVYYAGAIAELNALLEK